MNQLDDRIFESVVVEARRKASSDLVEANTSKRTAKAITRAVEEIKTNPYWQYDTVKRELLVLSRDSGNIYTANGTCQCEAFNRQQICWHRVAAKLLKRYFESISIVPAAVSPEVEPAPAPGGCVDVLIRAEGSARVVENWAI